MSEKLPLPAEEEKCFFLTSPFIEPARQYIHRNPVRRGQVKKPEERPRSSFRDYAFGEVGRVEIESEWTARRRELNCMSGEVPGDKLSFG